MTLLKQTLSLFLSGCLLLTTVPGAFATGGPVPRRTTGSGGATDSSTTAATGSAHRIVCGCLGGTDSRCRDVS